MSKATQLRVSVFQPVYKRVENELEVVNVVRCSECKGLNKTVKGVPPAKCEHCDKSEVIF